MSVAQASATIVLSGRSADPAMLGGKGAALDRLIGWGVRVPGTGVVTSLAYRAFVDQPVIARLIERLCTGAECSADEVDRQFAAVPVPAELRTAIVDLGMLVGAGRRLAVRSSATVEDLAESSFAGLYRSVLDVDPGDPDAVVRAVVSVFSSLWHPAPRAYRRALGIEEHDVAMAVVLMQMVPAARAGVVFTVDPADPAGPARVEAVEGLADSLVSGERTPDAWLLDPATEHPDVPPEIAAALDVACRIESLAGSPQDVEWAWADGTLWVVQARPITTSTDGDEGDGFDTPSGEADLTTAGIGEMIPGVLPPLLWQINAHLVEEAFRTVLDGLGLPLEELGAGTGLLRRVRGRAALDFSQLSRMATLLPGGAADELERQYFGSRRAGRPVARAHPRGSRLGAARHDLRVLVQQHRATQDAEIVIVATGEIGRTAPELGGLDTAELFGYRLRIIDLAVRAMAAELSVAAAAAAAYRRLELTLLPYVDEVESGRMAGSVTARPGVVAVPEATASTAIFGGPTWDELGRTPPEAHQRTAGPATDPVEDLRTRLRSTPRWDPDSPLSWFRWRRIEQIVGQTVEYLSRREHTKAAVLELGGEVRRIHREMGCRLVASGALEEAGDVDLLPEAELEAAFRGTRPPSGTVARRRRWMYQYEAEGPLPVRFSGRPIRQIHDLPPGGRLEGWGASAGRWTAPAAFLDAPDQVLPRGTILLAEATDSSWSPVFMEAGAIVLERGGPLSHAAILARELGVPAVLNVGTGVRALDGKLLTVDGTSGIVVVHDDGTGFEEDVA